jgi:hypothetical protein
LLKALAGLFLFQLINYLFAFFFGNADSLTFPLFICSFWLPMGIAFLVTNDNYKSVRKFLRVVILLQILLVILMQFGRGNILPNDFARGSTSSAHLFAFCITWLLFDYFIIKKFNIFSLLVIASAGFALFFGDAKSVIIIAIMALSTVLFAVLFKKTSFRFCLRCLSYIFMLAAVLFLSLFIHKFYLLSPKTDNYEFSLSDGSVEKALSKTKKAYGINRLFSLYVNGAMNHKAMFIERGFKHIIDNGLVLTGTSAGTLGSRASNVRASDILYKPQGVKLGFLGVYSSEATKKVYEGLYTAEYHRSAKSFIKILALPFSSFISFVFENGIFGLIILLSCLIYLLKIFLKSSHPLAMESVFLVFIILLFGIFDTIWERPFIMGIFYLILAINFRSLQNESPASDKYISQ